MMKRKFIPGSEWLYFKIYTGIKTADIILEEAIQPLVEYFQENNDISQWFFIRYNDPKPHLRIRFKLNNIQNYSNIFDKINTALQTYVDSGEISNVIVDTYNREIERYGEQAIEEAEVLFQKSSELVLQCLPYDDEEKIIVSLFYIDEILNTLHLPVLEKLDWMKDFNAAFKREFNADKSLNSQLDKKYRQFKPKLIDFIQSEEFSEERNTIISHIQKTDLAIQQIIRHNRSGALGISLQDFFQSIFHMHINRLFVSSQRLFEMVMYDYLLRYYKTENFNNDIVKKDI
ncbi:thiopeptide-type bacteriocin biosynthesis protein [Chryseobacterium soli]|uniref:thiopeptide-type bacteriocin biosynthesis protein n=1 Tax=Chryseobacterium soli TaxID=445961 RepID=UPI002953A230|nr:thiopeptide-type bacteriocin biosynthesis protein [Chryseobacterium soli]MDV7697835.1 thiopeptide-type bacteriocin biosynthesis protein [Chryseobacterium soli]